MLKMFADFNLLDSVHSWPQAAVVIVLTIVIGAVVVLLFGDFGSHDD